MSFRFNQTKSTELAALFLTLRGGQMHHLKLVKLMYLADREALARWGHPITGDRYVSMKHGPVLSNVLNLINGEERPGEAGGQWFECIQECEPHQVRLVKNPGSGNLSEAEVELAKEIFEKFGHQNRWALVDYTDRLPEYREPTADRLQWPIRWLDLLQAVGKTRKEAEDICAYIRSINSAKDLLGLKR